MITYIAIALSMFGFIIRAIAIGTTPKGTSGRNTKEGQVAESLNTKGIYSMVRHPLYLGNYFMWWQNHCTPLMPQQHFAGLLIL